MASISRVLIQYLSRRNFSTILSPDSKTPLSAKEKTRAALALIKSEDNPEKIVEACRAAALTTDSHLDRVAFSVAVSKLAKSNNFSYIRNFIDDLRAFRPDFRTERCASHSIILYGQANMLDDAVRTFKEFHDEITAVRGGRGSVKAFNALLFACILAKDHGEVKRIFVEFPKMYNIEPNLDTYNTVIKAFCEHGNSSSVYSILAEMDRKGVRPNTSCFGNLLTGFYKEEKYDDVGKVLTMMTEKYGIPPGISIYNVRIQSLCKLKKSRDAKTLFDGFVSRGVKPNSVTFCNLIHGFCREGDLEEAKRLFSSMGNYGCQPDADCYFTFVYYLCQGGDFEIALRVCKESIEKKWVPNVATMKSLVKGLGSLGKIEEAKELIAKIKGQFKKNVEQWDEVEAALAQ